MRRNRDGISKILPLDPARKTTEITGKTTHKPSRTVISRYDVQDEGRIFVELPPYLLCKRCGIQFDPKGDDICARER